MLGFVGCGNMAQAMLKGILAKGLYKADEIIVSRRTKEALDALHEELGVQTTTDNKEVAEKADVLVLAIKPYQFADVIPEIAPVCKENALVISIAAGQTIANIEKLFGKTMKIVRTMPNTPALVLAGATGMCFHPSVSKEERGTAITIFESFGVVAEVSENMIDTVIGVSGSSPAYVFMFIEAHPGELKDMVCSPAGTTIEAVRVLEEKGLRSAVIEGQMACVKKAREL